MKQKIQCLECGHIVELEIESIKRDKHIQCCFCGRISDNPLFEEEK